MAYDTILFDLDGTLLDTLEDLKDAVNHELEREGDPPRTLEEVRGFVGNGFRMLMTRALPQGLSQEEIDRRTASMAAWYGDHSQVRTRPYDGILPLLEALRQAGFVDEEILMLRATTDREELERLSRTYGLIVL